MADSKIILLEVIGGYMPKRYLDGKSSQERLNKEEGASTTQGGEPDPSLNLMGPEMMQFDRPLIWKKATTSFRLNTLLGLELFILQPWESIGMESTSRLLLLETKKFTH